MWSHMHESEPAQLIVGLGRPGAPSLSPIAWHVGYDQHSLSPDSCRTWPQAWLRKWFVTRYALQTCINMHTQGKSILCAGTYAVDNGTTNWLRKKREASQCKGGTNKPLWDNIKILWDNFTHSGKENENKINSMSLKYSHNQAHLGKHNRLLYTRVT